MAAPTIPLGDTDQGYALPWVGEICRIATTRPDSATTGAPEGVAQAASNSATRGKYVAVFFMLDGDV
jgi:hypothetical protein